MKDACDGQFETASKFDCGICSNDCMARLMFLLFCFVVGVIAVWSVWHLVELIFNSLN